MRSPKYTRPDMSRSRPWRLNRSARRRMRPRSSSSLSRLMSRRTSVANWLPGTLWAVIWSSSRSCASADR
ncbi:Uncharacterised protein [Mycobacterium tuberculosis]|nr:Uncharacterised protein [Mycobacterium tuberculosis]